MDFNATELNRMIAYLAQNADEKSEECKLFNDYIELQKKRFVEENNRGNKPFITVVTRTQGKRPDMLREMLLCLAGQDDIDFELIIAGHNLDGEQNRSVHELIDEMPDWMRARTFFVPVEGGTRTTPLLRAFEAANGLYVAILDDDDIVFANWISSFKEAYKKAPGTVLHGYALYQDWETVSSKLPNTPISMQKPSNVFCRDFILCDELTKNSCPLMTLAFPVYAFKTLNIRFDEELTTTEDWDFMMRTVFVCGIENIGNVTSIYRNWTNAENSQSVHRKKEWDYNYNKIVERFKQMPIFFDRHSVEKIISENLAPEHMIAVDREMALYYDDGHGFCEGNTVSPYCTGKKDMPYAFNGLNELGKLTKVRLDPAKHGNVTVSGFCMKVEFEDGSSVLYDKSNVITNAFTEDDTFVFIKEDPQIIAEFSQPKTVKAIEVTFKILSPVPNETIDALFLKKNKYKNLFFRGCRKIKRIIKNVFRR